MNSKWWLVIAVIVLSLVLAACAAPQQAMPSPAAAPAAEKPSAAPASPQQPGREQRLIEGAMKESEVVLWTHFLPEPGKLAKAFQDKYPFLKLKVWDARGTEILAKMGEEAKAGRRSVDVLVLSSEIVEAHQLGLLAEYEYQNVAGWSNQPATNFYKALGGAGRIVVYNTDLVAAAEAPKSWDDLKSTKWAGRTFASTSGEDTPLFWAYLWREGDNLNWDRSFAFWGDFFKNTRPRVVSGYTGPLERLVAGEAAMFPAVATVSVFRMMTKGAPLAIAPLGQVSGDTAGIGLAKDAPHPNAARLLIDWLTDAEGLVPWSDQTFYLVLSPQLANRSRGNLQLKSLGMAWEGISKEAMTPANLKKSADFWLKALGVRG